MTRVRRPGWVVVALLGVLPGCDSEETGVPEATFPPLEAVEELRIDGYERDLLPIRHVVVGPADQILIAQNQEVDVRVFAPDGEDVATFGGRGNGPGEFQVMYSLGFVGDTVWVYDSAVGRLTYFSPDYELLGTEPFGGLQAGFAKLRMGSATVDFRAALVDELLPDGDRQGRLLGPTVPDGTDFDSTLVTYANVGRDGEVTTVVARFSEGDMRVTIREPEWSLSTTVPFAMVPQYTAAPGGSRFGLLTVPMEGEHLGTVEITMWDAAGDTVYALRYPIETVGIPSAVADSALDAAADRYNTAIPGRSAGDAFRARAWTPPFYPPVEDFVVGRDGSAWMRIRSPAGSGSVYRVLDPEGEPYGLVTFSEDVDVEVADLSTVWGVVSDEFDVESVVRYAIRGG